MNKIKLLLTIFFVVFAYSCSTKQTIYTGKIINQDSIEYSIIKDKNQPLVYFVI